MTGTEFFTYELDQRTHKRCPACGIRKTVSEFHIKRDKYLSTIYVGTQVKCKPCANKRRTLNKEFRHDPHEQEKSMVLSADPNRWIAPSLLRPTNG